MTVAIDGAWLDREISSGDIERAVAVFPDDVAPAATISYCRNVFVPLTTACRYTCEYCTFYDPPGEATLVSPTEIADIAAMARDAGCTEVLLTLGDRPDDRYDAIHDQLADWGFGSIHEYLISACDQVLEAGLGPHVNPGDRTRAELAALAPVIASGGVMLETTADIEAHAGSRGKSPTERLQTIAAAGDVGIPFTTGILVGIGEDRRDRAESLLAIALLHAEYDHIQEVIIQPVVDNDRWEGGSPDQATVEQTVTMARAVLPAEVSIQVPPNLPYWESVLSCGVDDLGGISPVTHDYVNPDHEWPAIEALTERVDRPLRERLPVHERYLPASCRHSDFDGTPAPGDWLSPRVEGVISQLRADTPTTD